MEALDGTTFYNAYCKKRNKNTKIIAYNSLVQYVRFSNMGLRAGTHTGNAR
jgi:hypothetical protein